MKKHFYRLSLMLFVIFLASALFGCGTSNERGAIPISSDDALGEQHDLVVSSFKQNGFDNIKIIPLFDLEKEDQALNNNTIAEITINGESEFKENKKYDFASEIVIKYHTWSQEKLPMSSEDAEGLSLEEVQSNFYISNFFNVSYELIADEKKDNVNDQEVEYIIVSGMNFDNNHLYPVNTEIVVYYSFIEDNLPILSSDAKGMSYQEIKELFSNSKFEVQEKIIHDIDKDNIHEDEIEYIEIGSKSDYTLDMTFPVNQVVTVYHSYIEDKMPIDSKTVKGMNYEEAFDLFKGTLFNNVTLKGNQEASSVEVTETEVTKVTVNGKDYDSESTYPYNSEIVIEYTVKEYEVSVRLECVENLIFSKYDMTVYLDGDVKGALKHGETDEFTVTLKKGNYDLVLKSDDDDATGKAVLEVDSDCEYRYRVSCHSARIDLDNYHRLDIPYTNENVTGQFVNEVKDAFKFAGYESVQVIALNDLTVNDIKKSNTVSTVEINNNDSFTDDDIFYSDSKVVIYYHSGELIEIPVDSYDADNYDCKELVNLFKEAGFTNVRAEVYTGTYYSDSRNNLVHSVSIDEDDSFFSNSKVSFDAEVIIYYYQIEYKSVTVSKMMNDIDKNAYNAKNSYENGYFSVTGYVDEIDSNGSYIDLVASNSGWEILTVTCRIKDSSQKELLSKLSKNKKVTVKGKITSASEFGFYMDVHEIIIK